MSKFLQIFSVRPNKQPNQNITEYHSCARYCKCEPIHCRFIVILVFKVNDITIAIFTVIPKCAKLRNKYYFLSIMFLSEMKKEIHFHFDALCKNSKVPPLFSKNLPLENTQV